MARGLTVTTGTEAGLGQAIPTVADGGISARASPADFGATNAGYVGEIGQGLDKAAATADQLAKRDALIWAQSQATQGEAHWSQEMRQRQEQAPAGAPGFTDQVGKDYGDWSKQQLDAAPNAVARLALQERLETLAPRLASEAATFQKSEADAKNQYDIKGALDGASAEVYNDPSKYGDHLRQLHELADSSSLPGRVKGRMGLVLTQQLSKAMWSGMGDRDPRGTLAALQADNAPGMDLSDNLALRGHLAAQVSALDREAEHERKLAQAQAKAETAQRMAENRAGLADRMQDEVALRVDGQPVGKPLSKADFAAAYGPKQVDMAWGRYQDHVVKANALGLVKGASIEDQDKLLADNRPDPSKPGYADQAAGYGAMQQAVSEDRRRLLADPAADSLRSNPAVQKAWSDASQDPASLGKAVTLSLEEQQRRGVPEGALSPLPKSAASSAVEAWNGAQDAAGKLHAVLPYTLGLARVGQDGSPDDTLARKSLDQLEAAGLPAGVDRALEAYRGGDENRAREIMSALSVKAGDLPKLADTKGKELTTALTQLYQQPNLASAEAHAAIMTGQPGNVQLAARGRKLLGQLAQRYAADGEGADEAVQHAYRTAYGDGATAGNADLGVVPVPRGVDKDQLEAGLTVARQNVDVSHLAPTREAVAKMLPPGASQGEINGALAQATGDHALWADDVRQYSRWAPAPGGFQLVLPTGQAVTGADGKPRVWSADDITHHALGGAAQAETPAGQVVPGNIDLHARPVVKNADGSISTVRSMSFEEDGKHILVPTVTADGSGILSEKDAIAQYHRTGQHLGVFKSEAAATAYAKQLHEDQAKEYAPNPFRDLVTNRPDEGGMGGSR